MEMKCCGFTFWTEEYLDSVFLEYEFVEKTESIKAEIPNLSFCPNCGKNVREELRFRINREKDLENQLKLPLDN